MWVISLRGLRRRLRSWVKPMIILVMVALALWLISGLFRTEKPDIDPLLIPEEYLPLSYLPHEKPQGTLAAFLFLIRLG